MQVTRDARSCKLGPMPTIGRIGSLDVMIFRNDHDPPHFHVLGAEFSAKVAIADWGQSHRTELYLNWQLARDGEPPEKIVD